MQSRTSGDTAANAIERAVHGKSKAVEHGGFTRG
jgi:hypothetical protein